MSDKKEQVVVETANAEVSAEPKNEFIGSTNDRIFNEKATDQLNADLSKELAAYKLANGQNPSAKYLRQEIETQSIPAPISRMLKELLGFMEYVSEGKGIEYILTTQGTVTAMDSSTFNPSEVYEMSNDTYVDTVDLPTIGGANTKTKAIERSVALYKYIQYYLSGKANQVADIILKYMNDSMMLSVFQDLLAVLERMYAVIAAKTANTENYCVGTATNPVDAMREFKNFVEPFLSYNTSRNWGVDDGSTHTAFDGAQNFANPENLRFVTDYRTYNNIKKILPTIYHDDKLAKALLGDDSKWIIVPTSYLQVTNLSSSTINFKPTLVENYMLFKKDVATVPTRQPGTIMVIQKNDIKCAWNFEQHESEYYPKNAVTQVFMKKNLVVKPVKWAQVGVFENSHLEDDFVVPTV